MYRLYSAPNSYAMGAHAMLEEIAAPYELLPVALFQPDPDPDFKAASPHARVPALVYDGGTIFESGAIALFLAERHPEAGLSLAPEDPRRAAFLQWLFYLSSTLQPEVNIQFHPELYFDDAPTRAALKAASMVRLAAIWPVLDQAYAPGPYLFGDRVSAVDLCLAIQAVWPDCYPGAIEDYPNIARMVAAMQDRPAFQRMLAWHRAALEKRGRRYDWAGIRSNHA